MTAKTHSGNTSLNRARTVKDDEFYTLLDDVVNEVTYYLPQLKDKVVYANCDGPEHSAFAKYFKTLEYAGVIKEFKCSSDDFRAPHNIQTLREADVIITNPPFSLFREYFATLMKYEKKFLIISNLNAAKYKEILPYFIRDEVWIGYNPSGHSFNRPDGSVQKLGFSTWFTNLHHPGRDREIPLTVNYDPKKHRTYDNLNAINVDKMTDIPADYYGPIGVPFTFFEKYNPKQFRIIGLDTLMKRPEGRGSAKIDGKRKYARLIIQRV